MNRRELLKLISMGVLGHTLDLDKLLWVPGEKTIFLPPVRARTLSHAGIVALEWERMVPRIKDLFEHDEILYKALKKKELVTFRNPGMHCPIILKRKK